MEILPTMLVSDGKQTIRINVSDEAAWAKRGFVKPVEEIPPAATADEKTSGKRKACPS